MSKKDDTDVVYSYSNLDVFDIDDVLKGNNLIKKTTNLANLNQANTIFSDFKKWFSPYDLFFVNEEYWNLHLLIEAKKDKRSLKEFGFFEAGSSVVIRPMMDMVKGYDANTILKAIENNEDLLYLDSYESLAVDEYNKTKINATKKDEESTLGIKPSEIDELLKYDPKTIFRTYYDFTSKSTVKDLYNLSLQIKDDPFYVANKNDIKNLNAGIDDVLKDVDDIMKNYVSYTNSKEFNAKYESHWDSLDIFNKNNALFFFDVLKLTYNDFIAQKTLKQTNAVSKITNISAFEKFLFYHIKAIIDINAFLYDLALLKIRVLQDTSKKDINTIKQEVFNEFINKLPFFNQIQNFFKASNNAVTSGIIFNYKDALSKDDFKKFLELNKDLVTSNLSIIGLFHFLNEDAKNMILDTLYNVHITDANDFNYNLLKKLEYAFSEFKTKFNLNSNDMKTIIDALNKNINVFISFLNKDFNYDDDVSLLKQKTKIRK